MLKMRLTLSIGAAIGLIASTCQADWLRFRGPNGSGISPDSQATPVQWSPSENLKWKTELPGAGVSSPIIVGDRVFVTCYSGYGLDRQNPGEISNLKRHLVCVDRSSGKILWQKRRGCGPAGRSVRGNRCDRARLCIAYARFRRRSMSTRSSVSPACSRSTWMGMSCGRKALARRAIVRSGDHPRAPSSTEIC